MLHFEETIEQYMIHDTWGHVWQSELAQAKVYYDELANRKLPFFAEMINKVGDDVVAYTDIFYLNFKGELSFNTPLALEFIHSYFQSSMKLQFHATMSELCAEVTEYLFVFDYGSQIHLSSSSRFNHNPAKFDFAWSDMNYFSKMLNTPYTSILQNKNEFQQLCKKVELLLDLKYSNRRKNVKSVREYRGDIAKYNKQFLELFKHEFEENFCDPFKTRKNKEEHFVLKNFHQVLKLHSFLF